MYKERMVEHIEYMSTCLLSNILFDNSLDRGKIERIMIPIIVLRPYQIP